MEEKVRNYIDAICEKKFNAFKWIIGLLVAVLIGLLSTSFFSFRALGKMEADVNVIRHREYVDMTFFIEYMKRIENLVTAHEQLCQAMRDGDINRIQHIENDIQDIKIDIRNLANRIGIQTRSGNQ